MHDQQQPFGSAFLQHLANDAECAHWHCGQLPGGEHDGNCLNGPEPDTTTAPTLTWLIRRNEFSRVLPWTWVCTTRLTRDGFTQVCTGRGDARTKPAADTAAREHTATHPA